MKLYKNKNAGGMRSMFYDITFATPVGLLRVAECQGAIVQIQFVQENAEALANALHQETLLLLEAKRQLTEYFAACFLLVFSVK